VTDVGELMHQWVRDLFPLCRSLTGDGVRQTLAYLQRQLPSLAVHEVPTGYRAFDWEVPDEWNIKDAFVADETDRRVIDFRAHNLHVVGYSEPVDTWLDLNELQPHIHSLPAQPTAIPYVTSYYRRTWGFCMRDIDRRQLVSGRYHVVIDTTLEPGYLTYADLVLPGASSEEVLFSTYVCHPSMANNELSGPAVVTALARELSERATRRLTYRFVFVPETLGSLVYLTRHLEHMKRNTIAGWVVTCVGDDRQYSMLSSRSGNTLSDRLTRNVLRHHAGSFAEFDYLWPNRGSDERNYCAPGVDLPVASIMRTKYAEYPEYHTSLDDCTLVTPGGLAGSLGALRKCVEVLEANGHWAVTVLGEPRLGPRGLYPPHMPSQSDARLSLIMNMLAYCDGTVDLVQVADRIGVDAVTCSQVIKLLEREGLVRNVGA
jgi:aminopeptidase-like protein